MYELKKREEKSSAVDTENSHSSKENVSDCLKDVVLSIILLLVR